MRIQLFGPPAVLAAGKRFEHRSRKAMAMLAYLASRADEYVSRQHLSDLFWGDSGEDQARANLRQTLSQLRRLFRDAGHDPIMVPFDKIVLVSEGIAIDARSILSGDNRWDPLEVARLPAFLEGFSVRAPEFENWVRAQRSAIRSVLTTRLEKAALGAAERADVASAIECLSLALSIEPLKESLHRRLMSALVSAGRTDEALAQFESCRDILLRELNIEPAAETRRLASQIRAKRLGTVAGDETTGALRRGPVSGATLAFAFRKARGNGENVSIQKYSDARAALSEALEMRRLEDDPESIAIVVIADTNSPEADRAIAESLLAASAQGMIVAEESIYDQFRHWSPFAFEPVDMPQSEERVYALLSELPRHRLQISPSVEEPEVEPISEFSVAVLPLNDRSPSAAEFALGDVLSEEITHRLSRYRNLTVTAPSAGQTFRAQGFPVDQARRRLGVNYLIDGSVFRDGNDLRLNLTVMDLKTGSLVFSDHLDGRFDQIFSHRDGLIDRISTTVFRSAETAEVRRAERAPTSDIGAYEWYLRGLAAHRRAGISPNNARDAFAHFSRAIELDDRFARAFAWRICSVSWFAPEYFEDPGLAEIHYALSIDEYDAEVQRIAGALHLYRGDYEDGIKHIEYAVELNPCDAYLLASSAVYWAYNGEPQKGLPYIEKAMSLDPFMPVWCVEDHGVVLYSMAAYEEAISSLQNLPLPTKRALAYLAAAQVAAGRQKDAAATVAKIRHIDRNYSVDELMVTNYYRRKSDKAALRRRLHEAGLK